jgi:hypothetical protein
MMNIMLGGIMEAKVPADAMHPTESLVSYPYFCISGSERRPKIAVVAMDEPDMAPKAAQA